MKWYGLSSVRRQMPRNNNFHLYRKLRMRLLNMVLPPNNSYNWPIIGVIWPPLCSLTLIQSGEVYKHMACVMISDSFKSVIPLPPSQACFIDTNLHKLFIAPIPSSPLLSHYFRVLSLGLSPVMRIFVLKLKFRGKGFYLYRNARNVLRFRFGFSHRINRYFPTSNVRLTSKTSLMISGFNYSDVANAGVQV